MTQTKRSPKGIFFLLFIMLAAVGMATWMYTGPARSAQKIHLAMKQGDISTLRKHIDFPTLRSNIKVRMAKEVSKATRADGTGFGIGMELISGVVLDQAIGRLVTPEWLVGAGMAVPTDGHQTLDRTLSSEAHTRIVSHDTAHVDLIHEKGKLILIFQRRGLDWILVDVDGELKQF